MCAELFRWPKIDESIGVAADDDKDGARELSGRQVLKETDKQAGKPAAAAAAALNGRPAGQLVSVRGIRLSGHFIAASSQRTGQAKAGWLD